MKVVWTAGALADLNDVLAYTTEHYPSLVEPVERRMRAVVARVARWPESARLVEQREGIRVVPLVRYPYRIFYRVVGETVEVLHVYHSARDND